MKKTALVLSGGGFKGAFQAGALQYLNENWGRLRPDSPTLHFDIIAGVSVGSLNGLLTALGKQDELINLWQQVGKNGVSEIYQSDFVHTTPDPSDPNPQFKFNISWNTIKKHFPETTKNLFLKAIFNRNSIFNSFKKEFQSFRSIADNTPLKRKLRQYAKRNEIKNCIYKCGYVSLNDGKYYTMRHTDFQSDEDFVNGILASTAMPIIWDPVDHIHTAMGTQFHSVDGGIRNVSPLGDVVREIYEDTSMAEYLIIIINCNSGDVTAEDYEQKNIAQIALRSLADIAISEIFNTDIQQFIDKNYILEQVHRQYPDAAIHDYDFEHKHQSKRLRYFDTIVIQPEQGVLGDTLTANELLISRRMTHGMEKARFALEKHLSIDKGHKSTIT